MKNTQKLHQIAPKVYNMQFFSIQSGKFYTGQNFLHRHCLWCLQQMWGMPNYGFPRQIQVPTPSTKTQMLESLFAEVNMINNKCLGVCILVQSVTASVGHETEEEGWGASRILYLVFCLCICVLYLLVSLLMYLYLQSKSVGRVTEGRRRLSSDEVTQPSGKWGGVWGRKRLCLYLHLYFFLIC